MFKKLLKWIYLFISGLALLIILCSVVFCGYVYLVEDEVKLLIGNEQEYRFDKNDEPVFQILEIEEDLNLMAIQNTNEEPPSESNNKIKIKTKNGVAYLRHSQIYYIESGEDYHKIVATNNKEIKLNKRESPLKRISQVLNKHSCFYTIKSFVVNCAYIEQIERNIDFYGSKKFIIMENGDKIPLPEAHVDSLLFVLDEMFETNYDVEN